MHTSNTFNISNFVVTFVKLSHQLVTASDAEGDFVGFPRFVLGGVSLRLVSSPIEFSCGCKFAVGVSMAMDLLYNLC